MLGGREGMDDQGLHCLLSCWAGFKVFEDINILALPCQEGHLPQDLPSLLGLVDVTRVQGTRMVGCRAERLVELELDHKADEVPGVVVERGEDTEWMDPDGGCAREDVVLLIPWLHPPSWRSIIGFGVTAASTQSNLLKPFLL